MAGSCCCTRRASRYGRSTPGARDLAQQAPLSTRLGAAPRYEEHADPLYLEAARDALAAAAADDAALAMRARRISTTMPRAVVALLADLLDKRDQWLRALDDGDAGRYRAALEATLAARDRRRAGGNRGRISRGARRERSSARALCGGATSPSTPRRGISLDARSPARNGGLPATTVAARDDWRALAVVAARRRPAAVPRCARRRSAVFQPKGSGPGAAERARQSDAMKALLGELAAVPALAEHARRRAPPAASRATRTTRGPSSLRCSSCCRSSQRN